MSPSPAPGGAGTDSNFGIDIKDAGTLISTADGDISLTGTGLGTNFANLGVLLREGADIRSTGTGAGAGTITLTGTGGDGANYNYGVNLDDAGTEITSVDGDITLDGTGGDGSADNNRGISLDTSSRIASTGTGADAARIILDGTGGAGTNNNHGIRIGENANVVVTSVDGDILLTGVGGSDGSANSNAGIVLGSSSDITSTGTGANAADIALTGTGANGTSDNIGVYLTDPGTGIASVDGDISLDGTGGNGTGDNDNGIRIWLAPLLPPRAWARTRATSRSTATAAPAAAAIRVYTSRTMEPLFPRWMATSS